MATLGDPLADLGLLLVYWHVLGATSPSGNPVADGLGAAPGLPRRRRADRALRRAQRPSTGPAATGTSRLACFKLAVILEGIHYRYTLGQTVGAGFDRIGDAGAPAGRRTV